MIEVCYFIALQCIMSLHATSHHAFTTHYNLFHFILSCYIVLHCSLLHKWQFINLCKA